MTSPRPAQILKYWSDGMVKVELHTHTGDDPVDAIPYSTLDLIDRAADLGYGAVAITLHEHQLDLHRFEAYAAERGIVLIRGVERTIEGRHVLLLNFRRGADQVRTFAELAQLRQRERGLVIAPHAFFPGRSCLGRDLERHADLFDAVERNAMYTRFVDFNRRAERFARRTGKPMVGNGDVHRLMQLGTTWTMVDVAAGANADMICEAVAAGRVQVESRPLSVVDAARIVGALIVGIETATPVGDTDRRCATNSRLASSIAGLPISSGDISQS